jgi:hypothetical protein
MTASVGLSSNSASNATGKSTFGRHGRPYAKRHRCCAARSSSNSWKTTPSSRASFNEAMTGFAGMAEATVIAGYDVSSYATIVDVGGGHGRLQAGILAAVPAERCGNGGRGPRTRRGGRSSTACQQAGTHTS